MADDVVLTEAEITDALESLPGWEMREGWLRRKYSTPGFSHTMLLANAIGFLAEAAWHHPDLSIGYAEVTVKLQTHRVDGITQSDVDLARKIDEVVTWKPGEDSTSALSGYPKKWVH